MLHGNLGQYLDWQMGWWLPIWTRGTRGCSNSMGAHTRQPPWESLSQGAGKESHPLAELQEERCGFCPSDRTVDQPLLYRSLYLILLYRESYNILWHCNSTKRSVYKNGLSTNFSWFYSLWNQLKLFSTIQGFAGAQIALIYLFLLLFICSCYECLMFSRFWVDTVEWCTVVMICGGENTHHTLDCKVQYWRKAQSLFPSETWGRNW